jgi:hypothetical protein
MLTRKCPPSQTGLDQEANNLYLLERSVAEFILQASTRIIQEGRKERYDGF